MEEFHVSVGVELDEPSLKKVKNQLENIEVSPITLVIQDSDVVSEINSLKKQLQDVGNTKVNVNGFDSVKTSVNNAANTIQDMQRVLANMKFDRSSINTITKDLSTMNLEISNISTRIGRNGLNISVRGIDELGRAVTIVKEFDYESGQITSVGKTIAQSFDTSADAAKRYKAEVNSAFNDVLKTQKQISGLKFKLIGLDKTSEEAKELERQIEALKSKSDALKGVFGQDFSPKQSSRLDAELENASNKIDAFKAQMQDEIQLKVSTGDFETKFNSVKTTFESLNQPSDKLEANIRDLGTAFNTLQNKDSSIEDKIVAYEKFNSLLPIVKSQVSDVANAERENAKATKEAADANILLNKSQKLSNDITAWMNQNREAAERFGDRLKEIQDRLKDGVDAKGFREANSEFTKIKSEAKAAGLTVNSFAKQAKQAVLQMLGLGSSVMVLQKAVQIFKAMYQNVYEVDTAMTNLYKVTDETSSKYQQFLNNANKSAQELGKTVSSLIEQTATWAKLGYSIDESAELAKLSSVYANVAEIDDATAVSDMVTAMKAFNIEAQNAVTIIDPLNELGNKFATSAGDLGSGLSRSASAMKMAGADIHETLAMLTGGAEITQNANEFGNMLKIGSMRIRGMKGELEELGEEVDDTVDSISKVQTQVLNLTKGKVNIFDDVDEFRSYYEIMKDISKVYNDLTSTDRASLMEVLFGKQRGNQGAALIQAFQSGQIEKAYETAKNSAGSAMAEQEKWMESLEAKTQQFKASIETLSNTVLNSDFLKGMIDSGTTFLNILTAIVDKFGVFNTLAVSGGIVALVKSFD